ncbi:hypothetical protein [Glycomyces buryatensis]|uniref:Uncharacterized protein n=1 Tax=Glycomyces buryatensis TaxID=2570927 RepID=A0A4V4HSU2_9ACTN|nr:hypothetical protein [Glycomyces buryatensis]THV43026.1 hypothetical protein FAB82_03465 [Glycomyces buryatensis]
MSRLPPQRREGRRLNARHDGSPAGPTAAPLNPRGGRPESAAGITARIPIGEFRLGPNLIEVTAHHDGIGATVWLERVDPAAHEEIGYAVELDAAPRVRLYGDDWPPESHAFAAAEAQTIWKRALAEGMVRPWSTNSAMVRLGSVAVDERRVELVWCKLADTVLVSFTDIEPRRIGTVVMRECGPGFVAQPGHLDWLRYEDREARLLRAAVRLYAERCAAAESLCGGPRQALQGTGWFRRV